MKKIILSIMLAVFFVFPLFANASWWNPIDWFSYIKQIFTPRTVIVYIEVPATTTPAVTTTATPSHAVVSPAVKKPIKVSVPVNPAPTSIPIVTSMISTTPQPAVTDQQKLEMTNYLKGRTKILIELNDSFAPLNNRNVSSYSEVVSRTALQVRDINSEVSNLVIPNVSFSDLLANDQGILLQLQSDFFNYVLAVEYKQDDPIKMLDIINADAIKAQTSIINIKTKIRKEWGDEYVTQMSSYFR